MNEIVWVKITKIGDEVYAEGTSHSSCDKPYSAEYALAEWPLANGSIITESNTGDVYVLDALTPEWNKMFSLQGGGGGGGGADVMVVEFEYNATGANPVFTSNTAAADVVAAFQSGSTVVFHIPGSADYGVKEFDAAMIGYTPAQEYYGTDYDAEIWIIESSNMTGGNLITPLVIDANGYIEGQIYID